MRGALYNGGKEEVMFCAPDNTKQATVGMGKYPGQNTSNLQKASIPLSPAPLTSDSEDFKAVYLYCWNPPLVGFLSNSPQTGLTHWVLPSFELA